MQRGNYHTIFTPDPSQQPLLSIAVLYEDRECGRKAKRTCDLLVDNLDQRHSMRQQMWRFDVLSVPKLREMAARDVLTADVVVISCRGSYPLPPEVSESLEQWLAGPSQGLALVALFESSATEAWKTVQLRQELELAARRAGVEFFCEGPEAPIRAMRSEEEPVLPAHVRSAGPLTGATREVSVPQRWGINE